MQRSEKQRTKNKNQWRGGTVATTGPEKQVASMLESLKDPEIAGRATKKALVYTAKTIENAGGVAGGVAGVFFGGGAGITAGFFVGTPFGSPLKSAYLGGTAGGNVGLDFGRKVGKKVGKITTKPLLQAANYVGVAAATSAEEFKNTERKVNNTKATLSRKRDVKEALPKSLRKRSQS